MDILDIISMIIILPLAFTLGVLIGMIILVSVRMVSYPYLYKFRYTYIIAYALAHVFIIRGLGLKRGVSADTITFACFEFNYWYGVGSQSLVDYKEPPHYSRASGYSDSRIRKILHKLSLDAYHLGVAESESSYQ